MEKKKDILEKVKKIRDAGRGAELLKFLDATGRVDEDVADLCLALVPKEKDVLLSLSDLMDGVQDIKNRLKAEQKKEIKELKEKAKTLITAVKEDYEGDLGEEILDAIADLEKNG
jgi:hypothetical protein